MEKTNDGSGSHLEQPQENQPLTSKETGGSASQARAIATPAQLENHIPNDRDWAEYNDIEIVNWKRVRSSIEHENTLTNQRVTWLLSSQGFLLGAFMLIFAASLKSDFRGEAELQTQAVLTGIALAGVLISFFLSKSVYTAFAQHNALENWWEARNYDKNKHPPICGTEPRLSARLSLHYHNFPFVFIPVWIVLLSATWKNLAGPLSSIILGYSQGIIGLIGGLLLAVLFAITRSKPPNPGN